MTKAGRPSSPATAAALRMRDAVADYMADKGLLAADISRLAGVSPSSVLRVLNEAPPRERPALQKLHKYISDAQSERLDPALSAINRLTHGKNRHEAAAAAQILRAVADLLDRVDPH